MSDFRQAVEIDLSPPRVWAVMLDVEHWPDWNTAVTRVQRMDIGPLTLGSRTRIWQPKLMPAVWQVTSLDQKRRIFAWTTRTFGMKIVARHQVDAVGAHSRVSLSLNYSGVLGAIIARIYRDLELGLPRPRSQRPPPKMRTPNAAARCVPATSQKPQNFARHPERAARPEFSVPNHRVILNGAAWGPAFA